MQDIVTCKICGRKMPTADKGQRILCPNCGSKTRDISVEVNDTIKVSENVLNGKVTIVSSPTLLLQTLIVAGSTSSEGRLIEAVSIPWFEIISQIKGDSSVAYKISPEKWEEIIAGSYKQAGFDEVILTPRSGDFGRDVIAIKKGIGHVRIIDQVKAYKPGHLVKANDVRALMGVLHNDGASKGFLTTTSDFAPKIKEDPLITPFIPARLELINGSMLFKRLDELASKKS